MKPVRRLIKFLIPIGLLSAWMAFPVLARPAAESYRADRILIGPKPGNAQPALEKFHALHHCPVLHVFKQFGGIQVIGVPGGETVPSLIAKYQRSGLVTFAEPDYLAYSAATMPNDPYFTNGLLWGLYNFGQNGGTPGAGIDAPDAWDVRTSASNIVVAVVDSGILYTHEDLAGNMWVNPADGSHGWNAITETNDPIDSGGHGTLMAGTIGAVGNNATGVVGVAWQVQLMACVCLNSSGVGNNSDILECLNYAITNGARIINASFSSTNFSLATSNAIATARDAGIIVVAASGNASSDVDVQPTYPACLPIGNVVSVAYTTRNDTPGQMSNYGATNVTLAAPGDQMYSTFNNGGYWPPTGLGINIGGTSFSAAYVSGALALLEAQYPADGYVEIINRLLNSTDVLPALSGKCRTGGRLNLSRALRTVNVSVASADANPFLMRVSGGLNRTCVVQATTDLVNWSPVSTNTSPADGTFIYTNCVAAGGPAQFFRAVGSP